MNTIDKILNLFDGFLQENVGKGVKLSPIGKVDLRNGLNEILAEFENQISEQSVFDIGINDVPDNIVDEIREDGYQKGYDDCKDDLENTLQEVAAYLKDALEEINEFTEKSC